MNNKLFAILAVAVVLGASLTGAMATKPEEEPDELVVTGMAVAIVLGVVFASGFAIGAQTGWMLHDMSASSTADAQAYDRLAEANEITAVMEVASKFTTNANYNYAQIWGMTKEHWIRQAELEAYSQWETGKAYDPNLILKESYIYENNSTMSANALAQIDSFLNGTISDRVAMWQSDNASAVSMKDKMGISFFIDSNKLESRTGSFSGDFISIADSTGKTSEIYIGTIGEGYIVTESDYDAGFIYNFGAPTTITGEGKTYNLPTGKTNLSSLTGFKSGIYKVSNAMIGGDTLSTIIGPNAVKLKSGLAMNVNGTTSVAVWDGSNVVYNGGTYNVVKLQVKPDDVPADHNAPDMVDLTGVLKAYQQLLDKLYWTTVSANTAGAAVWEIYKQADNKDYHLTTLMNNNNYESPVLSKEMNEVMTLSAMKQLAEYYDANKGDLSDLTIGLYGTDATDVPFIRGSIVDKYGNTIYNDVIYTPFFYKEDTVLEKGVDYILDQTATVAIWANGQELSAWYASGMNATDYETLFLDEGYTFKISQMAVCGSDGMQNQSKVNLNINKVRYIEPEDTKLPDPIHQATSNPLLWICVVIGALITLFGAIRRDWRFIILGIGIIAFGVFLSGPIVEWFNSFKLPGLW